VGKTAVRKEIDSLFGSGLLRRIGTGKRGDAYRYWRPEIHSSAYREEVAEESISDTKSDPPEPGSPGMVDRYMGEYPSDPSTAPEIDSSATVTLYTEESKQALLAGARGYLPRRAANDTCGQ
jgi:hypothetical protein